MLSIQRPAVLVLSVGVIAGAFLLARARRRRSSLPLPLGVDGGDSFDSPVNADLLVLISRLAELVGVLALAVAASGPVALTFDTLWLDRGADVIFVLDASPSMSARDFGDKSRFEIAKELISEFAASRPADAVGLAAIGADAALLVPPTTDRRVFEDRLASLRIAELGDGTAIGLGLSVAALHLRSSGAVRAAAVLITDGENNAGPVHPETAAATLAATGARLYVVGVGRQGEVPVDYVDPATGTRRSGLMESRYDPRKLKAIAAAGGGTFIPAASTEALAAAFRTVDAAESVAVASLRRRREVPLYAVFAATGFVLFIFGRLLRRGFLKALL